MGCTMPERVIAPGVMRRFSSLGGSRWWYGVGGGIGGVCTRMIHGDGIQDTLRECINKPGGGGGGECSPPSESGVKGVRVSCTKNIQCRIKMTIITFPGLVQINSGSGRSSGLGEFWNDELAK